MSFVQMIQAVASLKVLVLLVLVDMSRALTCYQTNEKTGELVEVENEDFVFCVLFPSRRSLKNGVFVQGIADGMTQDDLDAPFDQFFDNSQPFYQVLSVCLYEKYNWPLVWKASPKFAGKAPEIEYQFRCLCNTDLCNARTTFEPYLTNLRKNADDNRTIRA
uniref:Uncharacterized protein n=1 Tax=Acrobeloides nanus TaxID=290746 RepID=A0A914CD41_9BILA